jgi:hypothetical protein
MRFFSDIPPEDIYFRTVPTFEVDTPALRWLTTSLFICSGGRTQDGVMLDFIASADFHFFNITVIAVGPFFPRLPRSILNTFKR